MKKYTLKEIKELINVEAGWIVLGLGSMIKDDPENDSLYEDVIRWKNSTEDINFILDDLIELENE